mmetsp:Transcript_43939/g.105999  ORF Transcript_43939/g.105999 Transcript_43939/m.105999 type:complete len:287 (+) Transcript_43939:190-1050(+)|eukprot:CAMPEP_0113631282 /NCGR_PEP_ID=MMETSP0017_2-20120614/16256_1 /TAXON_ID=2856 /ORGANISM="Cylindrotheca closterium" /LENGTH=286 /DNA_ID=CAMNT_0000541785 /DNA_START=146 /DNA_END=1006 /DNA_ORIENTATION=+ /assembly_acc=CAM_ASM_000147
MSSEPVENDANAGDAQQEPEAQSSLPLATHVKAMLEDLRDAKTMTQAVTAMKIVEKFIDVLDSDKEREKAKTILELNGVSTIVVALWKWAVSQEFSMFALATLCDLVYLEEDTKRVIVDIGGVDTVLMAAKKHSLTDAAFGFDEEVNKENATAGAGAGGGGGFMGVAVKRSKPKLPTKAQQSKDLPLKSNVVGLLGSLSFSDVSRVVVANEDCTDFVMSTMRQYPHHSHMQKWGCIYFFQISKDLEVKKMLEGKNIVTHLAKVVDNFRGSDPLVLEKAKPALKLFL